jgi:hypothetical protein
LDCNWATSWAWRIARLDWLGDKGKNYLGLELGDELVDELALELGDELVDELDAER